MSTAKTEESDVALLDINGLARQLGVSERFVRRLIEEQRVPYLKLGKFIRFDPGEIATWLDTKRISQKSR